MINKGPGSSWMRTLIEFMGVLGAIAALYLQYLQVQTIQIELETSQKEKQEVVKEKEKVVEENQELEKRIVKLQEPVTIDGTGKDPQTDTRPIRLETKKDLTSQSCANSDIEIKLDHIFFQKNYRMSWVFAIKNKTSVKQDIRLSNGYYPKMSLRDDQANYYPARYVDRINYIGPGASKNKTVQFDFPKEGARNFNVDFGSRGSSCFLLSPFSISLPDKLISSN